MTSEEWERGTEWPLALAALIFLAGYSLSVLDRDLTRVQHQILVGIDYFTWSLFALDYLIRVILAKPRLRYVLRHLPDLLIVVLPVLRPLRLLRLAALLRFVDRRVARSLQGQVGAYVALSSVLVLYSGTLAELSAERGAPGANIETFGTALWWGISTITTVGYGDYYPVTTQGRWVAAALMVAGVALLGAVTASLTSWLVNRVQTQTSAAEQTSQIELHELRQEVHSLTEELRSQRSGGGEVRP